MDNIKKDRTEKVKKSKLLKMCKKGGGEKTKNTIKKGGGLWDEIKNKNKNKKNKK